MDDQNKNLIFATVLSFLVILVWFFAFPPKPVDTPPTQTVSEQAAGAPASVAPPVTAPSGAAPGPGAANAAEESAPRIKIDTPRLTGSLSLLGGRMDTLALKDYHEELDPTSPNVTLLSSASAEHPYYAVYGWGPAGDLDAADLPGPDTLWSIERGGDLIPGQSVALRWDNGKGLIFHREIAVDDNYMFSITQRVENTTTAPVRMFPYGIVARFGEIPKSNFFILHEGVVRQADNELKEIKYKKMPDMDVSPTEGSPADTAQVAENGWIGFTDKYWMTALIPNPGQAFTAVAKYVPGAEIYQVQTRLPVVTVAAGETAQSQTMLFAGAKEWETIRHYQNDTGIYRFIDSIDWGWFFFLTKPIFWVLHFLHGFIGNMGWSIIALTLFLKALLFPLAYKSYVSMARMKELQPEIEKLKERAGEDRQKLQQEMMQLYKAKKVNPAAGCLPMLLQVPIFFSLYKVIFVTIELRHAPWLGWIRDLSAPDPTSILNLFGLLPYAPPSPDSMIAIVSLGVLPILLGISMWLQQKLNPAATDPSQAMIMGWMPWVFMFMLGRFASGLVLYWITNNTITFIQQYIIMRSHGHKPDVFGNIRSTFRRKSKAGTK